MVQVLTQEIKEHSYPQLDLNIFVLIKQVPVPKAMKTGADGLMDRSGKSMMNPHCAHALEEALALRDKVGGQISVVSMGPPNFSQSLKEALRKGADRAFLLSDRKLAGSDTWATAEALATTIKYITKKENKNIDVLFAGLQTIDGDTAHVGPQVAARLGLNQVTYVEKIDVIDKNNLDVRRIIEGGFQRIKIPMPVMLSIAASANTPRGPSLNYSIKAMDKEVTIYDIATIGLPEEKAGLPGSPTVVSRAINVTVERGELKLFNDGPMEDRINLLTEALFEDKDDGAEKQGLKMPENEEDKEKENRRKERDEAIPFVDLREDHRGIVTWAQMDKGELSEVSFEILGEATRIVEKLDEESKIITSVIIGKNAKKNAETLIHYGANRVYVIDDDRLEEYQTKAFTKAIIAAIKDIKPEIALFSATTIGRDLAPRVAAILDLGLCADATQFDVGYYANRRRNQRFEKAFKMIRPSFGDSKLATIIGPWTYPQMASARPGTFRPIKPDSSRKGEIIAFDPKFEDSDFNVEIIESMRKTDNIELNKADIVVSGGFGVGKDGFPLLQELVDAIKENGQRAELGASRAAVDAGFIEYKHQVGQTGKTVRPQVYIAIGISGAVQHIQGMKDSRLVVAINKDPKANIFKQSDFGIVADYQAAVPELLAKVKSGYKFPVN